ncbi:MAG: 3-deoxy-7-phosphoheptulonate synthase class II [Gemmatimonadetes bacterium]|nr:3-deoxy-7-phosphoheptulonate synthase class II [Gemmatimonadota bacterium]
MTDWSPDSWRRRPATQQARYKDTAALDAALEKIRSYPPLVTAGEVERLRAELSAAAKGRRFLLQGGDCAEKIEDCTSDRIASKLKILLQMSLVLIYGLNRPVIRVGRMAGQYAKPRSSSVERLAGKEIASYRGDLVNDFEPDERRRMPDPARMIQAYQHSALTLNFIRALIDGGFADLHHPEYWDMRDFHGTPAEAEYMKVVGAIQDSIGFLEGLGEIGTDLLDRVEFYTSHEGLHLPYEQAQTRTVPRREGYYDLGAHMLWIGERTRSIEGAHVEFFRGVRNPIGVKIGPTCAPEEAVELARRLNPNAEPGRIVLITRHGADQVDRYLPPLIRAIRDAKLPVVWCCDPMHGNVIKTRSGRKTRSFEAILDELGATIRAHEMAGTILGGVHLELTGERVTECIGGALGLTEDDLDESYETFCDPRLNYSQSLEVALLLARRLGGEGRIS